MCVCSQREPPKFQLRLASQIGSPTAEAFHRDIKSAGAAGRSPGLRKDKH
jgi:hypothetical protein